MLCNLGHEHPDEVAETNEADVAEEAVAADAAVRIAEIEGSTQIALAKISAKAEESHDETEVEALRAEIRGFREALSTLMPAPEPVTEEPAPEPEPVVVEAQAPEVEAPPAADEHEHRERKPAKRGMGMW